LAAYKQIGYDQINANGNGRRFTVTTPPLLKFCPAPDGLQITQCLYRSVSKQKNKNKKKTMKDT